MFYAAPYFFVLMSQKRRLREYHGRVTPQKPTCYDIFMLNVLTSSQRSTVDFVSLTPASVPFSNSIMSMLSGRKGFHKILFFSGRFLRYFFITLFNTASSAAPEILLFRRMLGSNPEPEVLNFLWSSGIHSQPCGFDSWFP